MKITRRQLNSLIREHLALENQELLNEFLPALPVLLKVGAAAATLIPAAISGFEENMGYSPSKDAKILLDHRNTFNPVALMKPLLGAQDTVVIGMDKSELAPIADMLESAMDVDLYDATIGGEGATNEALISEALGRCNSQYAVAQLAHYWKEYKPDTESLYSELYSALSESDFRRYVVTPINSISENFVEGKKKTGNGWVKFGMNKEKFMAQLKKDYEAMKIEGGFPEEKEAEAEPEEAEKNKELSKQG